MSLVVMDDQDSYPMPEIDFLFAHNRGANGKHELRYLRFGVMEGGVELILLVDV